MDSSIARRYAAIGGALGALAVIAGAFGAHGLESRLDADLLEVWHTAATYHMYHAIALFAFALAGLGGAPSGLARWACRAWIAGIAIFSGSLYLLAVTGAKWLGAITPIGGVAFITGWVLATLSVRKARGIRN